MADAVTEPGGGVKGASLSNCTVKPSTKFRPFTVRGDAGSPAVASCGSKPVICGFGLFTVKVTAFDVASCEFGSFTSFGLNTVTGGFVPALSMAMSLLSMPAISCLVPESNVVLRGDPFHCTCDSFLNPVPFTVRSNPASPAVFSVGSMESMWKPAYFTSSRPSNEAHPTNRSSAITANRRTAARITNGSIIARYSSGVRPVPVAAPFRFFRFSCRVPQSFPWQRLSRRLRVGSFRLGRILDLLHGKTAVADVLHQTKPVQEDGRGPDVYPIGERDWALRVGHHDRRQSMFRGDLFGQFGRFPVVDRQHDGPPTSRTGKRFLEVAQRLQAWLRCALPENEHNRTPRKLAQSELPAGSVLEQKVWRRLSNSHVQLEQTRSESPAGD